MDRPEPPEDTQDTLAVKLVHMTSAQTYKFYEPIVLLKALNDRPGTTAVATSAARSSTDFLDLDDPDDLFRAFVYKLAHVCDSEKGRNGATITSFTLLRSERPETADEIVHYYFASNRRTMPELENTKAYVHALLVKIYHTSKDADPYRSNVLRDIISFNRIRIQLYLSRLRDNVRECKGKAGFLFPPDDIAEAVADFDRVLNVFERPWPWACSQSDKSSFAYNCEHLMRRLTTFETSATGKTVAEHVKLHYSEVPLSDNCWYQLQHAMSRILAYPKSLACMLKARRRWPILFRDFRIFALPSSQPQARIKGRRKSYAAEGIVGRMTRRPTDIERFRNYVEDLQKHDLDQRIVAEFQDEYFRPIVHCEVILLNFLECSSDGISPARFWEGLKERMYIGSSKPLCRLCKYYFEEHGANVGHRATHGNLYKNWGFPDVVWSQGGSAIIRREKMLDRVLKRIRADAFGLIMDRVGPRVSENDSNTFSANISLRGTLSTIAPSDIDEVTSMFGGASLNEDYEV